MPKSVKSWLFLLGVCFFFSLSAALGLLTQRSSGEVLEFISYRTISPATLFHFLTLSLIVTVLLLLLHLITRREAPFYKGMLPLLLLYAYPYSLVTKIGSEPAWFNQTQFYFLMGFIVLAGLTVFVFFLSGKLVRLSHSIPIPVPHIMLGLGIGAFLFIGYFALLRYFDITIEKPDSHVYITVFWNTAHGNILRSTLDGVRNWFSYHFQPTLFLFSLPYLLRLPSFWVLPLLQLLQVGIGVSGIIPVFLLAKRKLHSSKLAVLLALQYLLLPALQFQLLYDFHPEIISLVAILWAIYFLETKRYPLLFVFLMVAIATREEFALFASLFGIYMIFKKDQNRTLGTVLILAGIIYWLTVKFMIIPYFGRGQIAPAQESMFSNLGESPSEIITNVLANPGEIISFMFSQRKIQYLFLMFLSSGFLILLSPVILFTVPYFSINLLLNFGLPSSIFWHYQSWLIPLMVWAGIDFLARRKPDKRLAFASFLFTATLLTSLYFGPTNFLSMDFGPSQKGFFELKKSPEVASIKDILKVIPGEASVAADSGIAPYFAARKDFYIFPAKQNTDFIVSPLRSFVNYYGLHTTLTKKGYCLQGFGSILVYRRQSSCKGDWDDTLVIDQEPIPELSYPITPSAVNKPFTLTHKLHYATLQQEKAWLPAFEYQLTAQAPSIIRIDASADGKHFVTVTDCSTLKDESCVYRNELADYLNQDNEVYLRLYLLANDKISKDPGKVRIDQLLKQSLLIK